MNSFTANFSLTFEVFEERREHSFIVDRNSAKHVF